MSGEKLQSPLPDVEQHQQHTLVEAIPTKEGVPNVAPSEIKDTKTIILEEEDDNNKIDNHKSNGNNNSNNEKKEEKWDAQIIKQVEFYLGDECIVKDKYLMKKLKMDFVPIDLLMTFQKMKSICKDKDRIVAALLKSDKLRLSKDCRCVGRKYYRTTPSNSVTSMDGNRNSNNEESNTSSNENEESNSSSNEENSTHNSNNNNSNNSIEIHNLDENDTFASLWEQFSKFGEICGLRIINKTYNHPRYAVTEYINQCSTVLAVEKFKGNMNWRSGSNGYTVTHAVDKNNNHGNSNGTRSRNNSMNSRRQRSTSFADEVTDRHSNHSFGGDKESNYCSSRPRSRSDSAKKDKHNKANSNKTPEHRPRAKSDIMKNELNNSGRKRAKSFGNNCDLDTGNGTALDESQSAAEKKSPDEPYVGYIHSIKEATAYIRRANKKKGGTVGFTIADAEEGSIMKIGDCVQYMLTRDKVTRRLSAIDVKVVEGPSTNDLNEELRLAEEKTTENTAANSIVAIDLDDVPLAFILVDDSKSLSPPVTRTRAGTDVVAGSGKNSRSPTFVDKKGGARSRAKSFGNYSEGRSRASSNVVTFRQAMGPDGTLGFHPGTGRSRGASLTTPSK